MFGKGWRYGDEEKKRFYVQINFGGRNSAQNSAHAWRVHLFFIEKFNQAKAEKWLK